jgi:hypothetical protein
MPVHPGAVIRARAAGGRSLVASIQSASPTAWLARVPHLLLAPAAPGLRQIHLGDRRAR